MTVFCIIPARAGSKRFPGKHLAELHGIPLITYAITKALKSDCDSVIVTTDDSSIIKYLGKGALARQSRKVHLDVRPSKHATGASGKLRDYITNFLIPAWNIEGGDIIVLLQCVYPFVTVEDINWCIKEVEDNDLIGSAQTTCIVPGQFHPYNLRCRFNQPYTNPSIKMDMLEWLNPIDKYESWIQQEQPTFRAFGGVVACWAAEFQAHEDAPFQPPMAYRDVSIDAALDVNEPADLERAEALWGHDIS